MEIFAIYTRFSTFSIYAIIEQNCAGSKQESYKIMGMNMLAAWGKAKPGTENIRGLNLVPVKLTTVHMTISLM
jgi:hypothetical protein